MDDTPGRDFIDEENIEDVRVFIEREFVRKDTGELHGVEFYV